MHTPRRAAGDAGEPRLVRNGSPSRYWRDGDGFMMEKRLGMPESDITIREAIDADVPEIVTVLRTAFAEQATLAPPSGALNETGGECARIDADGRVALAVMDNAIVGCQFFEPKDDHLYSLPARRPAHLPPARHWPRADRLRGGAARHSLSCARSSASASRCPSSVPTTSGWATASSNTAPTRAFRTNFRHPRQRHHCVVAPPSL